MRRLEHFGRVRAPGRTLGPVIGQTILDCPTLVFEEQALCNPTTNTTVIPVNENPTAPGTIVKITGVESATQGYPPEYIGLTRVWKLTGDYDDELQGFVGVWPD